MPLYSSTTHECGTAVESSEPPETSSQGVPAEIGTSTSSVTEVLAIKGIVKKTGNGAHVLVPKSWIGREVHVEPTLNEPQAQEPDAPKAVPDA